MFRRGETGRERSLLRQLEQQQRTINDLVDRIMAMSGTPWNTPETPQFEEPDGDVYVGALDGTPPGWED